MVALWWLLIAAAIAVFVVIALAWSTISNWLWQNTTDLSDYHQVIKDRLESGNYRVVAGVFRKRLWGLWHQETASQAWEVSEVDGEIMRRFGATSRIRITVR